MKNRLAMVDLDGTLVNTINVNYYAYKEALGSVGCDIEFEYFREKCYGSSYKTFLPKILGNKISEIETVHKKKKEFYAKYLDKAKLNSALADILRAIKSEYYLAIVTTASRQNCIGMLDHLGLTTLFDLIVTGETVEKVKPDLAPFLYAADHFKISKENCVIFEDSPLGIESAKRAGISYFVAGC